MDRGGNMNRPIHLIVVEDEPLFRNLLEIALKQDADYQVLAAVANADDAVEIGKRTRLDVAILDIDLGPGPTGIEAGLALRRVWPHVGIVLLSNYDQPELLGGIPPEQMRGWSYLLKKSVTDLQMLKRAIEGSFVGLMVLDSRLVHRMRTGQHGPLARLTPRQLDILRLMAQGYSNGAIARRLVITEKSVENLVGQVYQNLGIETGSNVVHARVKATLLFLEESTRALGK